MNKANKPLTQREIRQQKKQKTTGRVVIYNRDPKRPVQIQLRAPKGVDFFHGEQSTNLGPGKQCPYPASRLFVEQIVNHEKAGRIKILSGREHLKI